MKSFFTTVMFTLSVLSLMAQDAPPPRQITVDEAVRLAMEQNLNLKIEDNKNQVLRRNRDFALNRFIPSLTASATLSRLNEQQKITSFVTSTQPPFISTKTIEIDPWTLGLNFSAQLPLSIALFRGIEQTFIEYDNGLLTYFIAQRRLERDVRKLFNQILALEEAVKITQLRLENARTRYLQADEAYRAGRLQEINALQARVAWENTKPTLREQELSLETLKMNFKMLLGIELNENIVFVGDIKAVSFTLALTPQSLQRLLDQRLDVMNIGANIRSPNLILMLSMDPSLAEPFNADSWSKENAWKQRGGMFSISLSWKLDSLIPGSQAWVNIKSLEDQLEQLRLTLAQVKMASAVDLLSLVQRIQKYRESLAALEANVNLAQRVVQLSNNAYRAGLQSLSEVQDAELQLQSAQLQLINEKISLNNSILDLIYSLDFKEGENQ